jgi:hypothetical protein
LKLKGKVWTPFRDVDEQGGPILGEDWINDPRLKVEEDYGRGVRASAMNTTSTSPNPGLSELLDADEKPENSSDERQDATPVPASPEDCDDEEEDACDGAPDRLLAVNGMGVCRGHACLHSG